MEQSSSADTKRLFFENPVTVIFGAASLFFASQLVGGLLASLVFLPFTDNKSYQLLAFVGCNILALVGLLSIARSVLKFDLKAIGLVVPKAKSFLMVLPAFFLYFAVSAAFTYFATKFIPGFKADQVQDVGLSNLISTPELIAGFLSLVVFTPLYEELIFRGVLFKGLRRKLPFWWSAVLTSIVFGIAHLQWNVAVDVFALSLILCYLMEKSGSVVPAMVLHALKNSLAFILLFVVK